jgi:hypothetical protein
MKRKKTKLLSITEPPEVRPGIRQLAWCLPEPLDHRREDQVQPNEAIGESSGDDIASGGGNRCAGTNRT